MARQAVQALLLFGLLCSLAPAPKGQDFDLSDALPDDNKKPTTKAPKRPGNDDFDLGDALPDGEKGTFSDSDPSEETSERAGDGSQRHNGEEQATSPAVIPGIVGSVALAVVGAISSFIAYQKKKLCFKDSGDLNV